MDNSGLIRAFQKVLENWNFKEPASFSEAFAQARFSKKFEAPKPDSEVDLRPAKCWDEWITSDSELITEIGPFTLAPEWREARILLHQQLGTCNFRDIHIPQGSEFIPTLGRNSVEAKLCASEWTVTYDGFSRFARICYNHRALKKATRVRYKQRACQEAKRLGISIQSYLRTANRRFWKVARHQPGDLGYLVFKEKLALCVTFTQGSRFATVPKNNEVVRPINVEPFGNMVCQRAVGSFLRHQIKHLFGVDLDTLAQDHRKKISCNRLATIDLKNASDRISLALVRYLLPKRVLKHIEALRSEMILGPDGEYHIVKKVSSMGNGFTFELMSLILTAICRVLDPDATVFGDDIIINKTVAPRLIELLEEVQLVVNRNKSFLSGPFRESCGANYHDEEGYVESFDFHWPTTIGDCVLVYNKACRLGLRYKSFKELHLALHRHVPPALQGGPCPEFTKANLLELIGCGSSFGRHIDMVDIPLFFVTEKKPKNARRLNDDNREYLNSIHEDHHEFYLVPGFEFKSDLRSQTLSHLSARRHWAKLLMFLHGGRRCKDAITGEGKWVRVWFIKSNVRSFRASSVRS